jgi:flavin reductase (DIM6/NTAB) family NADH-FMN oxidoreductase RutF
MNREEINSGELRINAVNQWDKNWFLLTSGSFLERKFNSMTISWGSIGVMWGKPFVQVVVRPSRHTYTFMEKYSDFTICSFGPEYKKILNLLGSKSGRDMDKINHSGLTPIGSKKVASPGFTEANLILECRTMYKARITPDQFKDATIESSYPSKDYHTSYFGEILHIEGIRNQYT